GSVVGASQPKGGQKIEVAINGERVALLDFNPDMKVSDDLRTPPIKIEAGPKTVSVSFLTTSSGPVDDFVMPFRQALADLSTGHIAGLTALPHLRVLGFQGLYPPRGVGDRFTGRKILICGPTGRAKGIAGARNLVRT